MDNKQNNLEQSIAKICLECDLPNCNAGKCVRYKRLSRAILHGEDCADVIDKKPYAETYTHNGKTMTLREWAKYSGISYATLKTRMRRHGDFKKAITEDVRQSKFRYVEWEGKTVRLSTLCMRYGIGYGALHERLTHGMSLYDALHTPVRKLRFVEWEGNTVKLTDLCAKYGIGYDVVSGRLRRGWSLDEAITTPIKQK